MKKADEGKDAKASGFALAVTPAKGTLGLAINLGGIALAVALVLYEARASGRRRPMRNLLGRLE